MKFSQLMSDNPTIKNVCGKVELVFISGDMSGLIDLSHINVYF